MTNFFVLFVYLQVKRRVAHRIAKGKKLMKSTLGFMLFLRTI